MKGLYILDTEQGTYNRVYESFDAAQQINAMIDIYAQPQNPEMIKENLDLLAEAEVILSSWGAPVMDEEFLSHAPKLKAVFYAAGSIKYFVTDAFWNRGIKITTANGEMAKSVATFTVAQIVHCLKKTWHYAQFIRDNKCYPPDFPVLTYPGIYRTTVGLISLGQIAQYVSEYLKPYELNLIAYDPFVSEDYARKINVKMCSLEEVFKSADVVSLHTPLLEETQNMIRKKHFESMKQDACFINTARGAVVCEDEMVEVLKKRQDLSAMLDVTCTEPPPKGSILYELPNVMITPHIAGGMGNECGRLGCFVAEELKRFLNGQKMLGEINNSGQIKNKA